MKNDFGIGLRPMAILFALAMVAVFAVSGSPAHAAQSCNVGADGERCVSLTPDFDTNPVGTDHTVTATLTLDGAPWPFNVSKQMDIQVISGPNAGAAGTCTVNANCSTDAATGKASFTYTGNGGVGIDTIRTCAPFDAPDVTLCVEVQKEWVVVAAEFCEARLKPSVLTMQLAGGGAGDSNHSQDSGKVTVTGSDVTSGPVYIISTDKDDPTNSKAKIWFAGSVNIGDSFDISAVGINKDDKLKGNTRVFIYDADPGLGGSLIQSIEFHTSCSQPLNGGDQYGAVVLSGFAGV